MKSDLEDVQAGSILVSVDSHAQSRVVTVDRVTKTQIVIGHSKYRKSDGTMIGQGIWTRGHIRWPRNENEVTEIKSEERRKMLARRVSDRCQLHNIRDLPLESLEQLNKTIQQICGDTNGS